MPTLSIEIPDDMNAALMEMARERGEPVGQLASELLLDSLLRQKQEPPPGSFAALAVHILDLPSDENGPTDLSTNKKHLEGYGEW